MQILIELAASNDGIIHSNEKEKHNWERSRLFELLTKLESNGYRINTLYGNFIFDHSKKEVIDCGEAGPKIPLSMDLVDSIFATDGKMAVIFIDQKYIAFADRFFAGIHFCHTRKVRPLSIYTVIDNFDELIIKENNKLLRNLYLRQFEFTFGNGREPVSCSVGTTLQ